LFVEEIASALRERGVVGRGPAAAAVDIPPTIQDIIRARIDRLGDPVKRTVQNAAVIGREFPLRLLTRISDGTPEALHSSVETLERMEVIYAVTLRDELLRRVQLLDHLKRPDHIERADRERLRNQVGFLEADPWIEHRRSAQHLRLQIDRRHRRRPIGEHPGAVALAASCVEHVHAPDHLRDVAVDHDVALEPVVLVGDAGRRSFAGQWERLVGVESHWFGHERADSTCWPRRLHPAPIMCLRGQRMG
jgi:hypothetical protein